MRIKTRMFFQVQKPYLPGSNSSRVLSNEIPMLLSPEYGGATNTSRYSRCRSELLDLYPVIIF